MSCSEKSGVIISTFESFSNLVSSSQEISNGSNWEEISFNELEEPSNILSASRCDNYNINYPGKSAKIV